MSHQDSTRIEPENEGETSDGEFYGAGCSNQSKVVNSPPEGTGHWETSGSSHSCLPYMHPFSNLCAPPSILPVMTSFVPLRKFHNYRSNFFNKKQIS